MDASAADALADGEQVTQTFTAAVLQTHYADAAHTIPDGAFTTAETFTVTITGVNDAPTVANGIADQAATEDSAFTFALPANTFTDADAGDILTLSATLADDTALPGWLHFDAATGTFSGTPLNADVSTLSVKVTAADSSNASASDTFQITVTGVNDAPVITELAGATSSSPIFVPENTAGDFITITATDAENQTLTYSIGPNPDGSYDNNFFTINPTTGALGFTSPPDFEFTDPGNDDLYKVQVTVTDAQGDSAVRDYFVQVTDVETTTIDFTGINTSALYVEDGFTFSATGNHTDASNELYWHDGGANPGDNDIIMSAVGGQTFSILSLDVVFGPFSIVTSAGTFSYTGGSATDVAVNLVGISSAVFETDLSGAVIDNILVAV